MRRYDYIIVGAGAAGLTLAYQMSQSPLRDRSILVIDKSPASCRDRAWAFWTDRPTCFDSAVYRSWPRLKIISAKEQRTAKPGPYRYKTIRGADFQDFVHSRLSRHPNIEFLTGTVENVTDGKGASSAIVNVGGQEYSGSWVFDSRFKMADFHPDPQKTRLLKMQFLGFEIECDRDTFDPRAITFLDFRTLQRCSLSPAGAMCFIYVLPYSGREALVEHVACTALPVSEIEHEKALEIYIHDILRIDNCRIIAREHGVSPMTDYRFPRQKGRRIMSIGVPAGMLKPSTGFAFTRIQRDSAAIVESLVQHGHPFEVPSPSWIYRFCDSLLLRGMSRHGGRMSAVLTTFFRYGSASRILRFLDERGLPI